MSVKFRPDRNKWQCSTTVRGKRVRPLFATKREAEQFEKKSKLKRYDLEDAVEDTTIDDGFKSYFEEVSRSKHPTSMCNDRRYFNLAFHFLTVERNLELVHEINLQDLEALQKWLAKEQGLGEGKLKPAIKASAINRYFHTYSHFFAKMCAWGKLKTNPCEHLKSMQESEVHREPLTREIYEKIRTAAPAWYQDVIDFIYFTGARGSSVERLVWDRVDFKSRLVQLDSKKGASAEIKTINLPMIEPVFAALVRTRNRWPDAAGAVFRYDTGDPVKGDHLSKVGNRLLKDAGFKVGDKRVDIYGARHSLASELTDAGVPTEVVRQLLGHSSIKTTQNYAKGTNMETLRSALSLVRSDRETVAPDGTNTPEVVASGAVKVSGT